MRHNRPAAAALLLACLVVAGCGGRGGPASSAATATPTSTTGTAAAPAADTAPAAGTATGQATGPSAAPVAAKTSGCAYTQRWGIGTRQRAPYTGTPYYRVRAGRHACYDRVVFDLNGPDPVGYHVRYVDVVRTDGAGIPVPVAGRAALEVILHAPPQGLDEQGHQPWRPAPKPGTDYYAPAQLAGWRALEQVRYAGFFEGQTTIAVGTRTRLPFRVFTVPDTRNQVTRVVLDIAH
jgi:hypothetical protein